MDSTEEDDSFSPDSSAESVENDEEENAEDEDAFSPDSSDESLDNTEEDIENQ